MMICMIIVIYFYFVLSNLIVFLFVVKSAKKFINYHTFECQNDQVELKQLVNILIPFKSL